MEATVHLYLSPHLDDAVFSCGGRMWRQAQAGQRVTILTVFAGAPEPDARLSPYAQQLHARWGQPVEAARQRQAEDLEALALLGAEAIHWPYVDCIYRRTPEGDFPYASEDALWGETHPSDAGLIEELARRLSALPLPAEGPLYVPLAVGGHVDHRILRRAAEACRPPLTYYEDFPYARDPRALNAALPRGLWTAELVPLSRQALEAKAAAIACYRSQVSTFWEDPNEVDATVRAFARRTGGGEPAERYWHAAPRR